MATQAHAAHEQIRSVAPAAWPRQTQRVKVVRRIHNRWTDLYGLVLDVERYPAFVPGCRAVKVYSRADAPAGHSMIVSRMTAGVAGFDVSYANRTIGDAAARRIEVAALDGPLRRLDVLWTFEPDGQEWTNVRFCVDYAFNSAILSALASSAFDAMFGKIVAAFERRADRLFTNKSV
jgi:coenzyme Q-binding protein COQ10